MYDTMSVLYDSNVCDVQRYVRAVRSYVRHNERHYVRRNVPFYARRYVCAARLLNIQVLPETAPHSNDVVTSFYA